MAFVLTPLAYNTPCSCAASINFAFDGLDANGAGFSTAAQVRGETMCSRVANYMKTAPSHPLHSAAFITAARLICDVRLPLPIPNNQVRKLNSYSLVSLFARGKALFFDFVSHESTAAWTANAPLPADACTAPPPLLLYCRSRHRNPLHQHTHNVTPPHTHNHN